jgi:hypothetical protein
LQAADPNASFGQTHEALKTLMKAAGLEAKDEKKADTGPSFQISIDLGGGQSISLSNNVAQSAIDVETKQISNS